MTTYVSYLEFMFSSWVPMPSSHIGTLSIERKVVPVERLVVRVAVSLAGAVTAQVWVDAPAVLPN